MHRIAQVEADVDRELGALAAFRQTRERLERLLETNDRLAMRGTARRGKARLAAVAHGVLPHLAAERVMCEKLDLAGAGLRVGALQRLDDAPVQRPPAIVQQAAVGDLVRERMLERVFGI